MSSLVSTGGSAPAWERRMAIVGHGFEKFPTGRLLASSAERRWPGLFAECRSHPAGDLPTYVPTYTEVALLLRGPSTVTRQADGVCQRTAAIPGTIWLCPAGLREDFITISDDIPEALHIYLPSRPFSALQTDYGSWDIGVASLRYESGLRLALLHELVPTARVFGFLVNPANRILDELTTRDVVAAAAALGVPVQIVQAAKSTPPSRISAKSESVPCLSPMMHSSTAGSNNSWRSRRATQFR